ncbi:MAG: Tim44 domain-containing protein [Proteobacteria bacterium]|nr:Tim44 domain-containing protein [Pseudomonadota bacterium]MBU1059020.1 Tim44 domain-containing protein [Pseudomonadota bacterium]
MLYFLRRLTPFFLVFFTLCFIEAGITADYADARSRGGGRSFKSTPSKQSPAVQKSTGQQKSGFGRGLAGGLIGGALGGMLLGSMFGMGGSGMGILPFLLLGVVGFFLYKRFMARPTAGSSPGYQPPPRQENSFPGNSSSDAGGFASPPPPPAEPMESSLEEGVARIRIADPDFDPNYFVEVASDVFFKVQAGWMRRDISSYGHLLGEQLASEYKTQFAEMEAKGEINKLESISVRKVEVVAAGSENGEDFVTVLFTANLLDYTVDDKSGDLISGSMTEPVKFAEEWSWARPLGTQDWKLEGIKEV